MVCLASARKKAPRLMGFQFNNAAFAKKESKKTRFLDLKNATTFLSFVKNVQNSLTPAPSDVRILSNAA